MAVGAVVLELGSSVVVGVAVVVDLKSSHRVP